MSTPCATTAGRHSRRLYCQGRRRVGGGSRRGRRSARTRACRSGLGRRSQWPPPRPATVNTRSPSTGTRSPRGLDRRAGQGNLRGRSQGDATIDALLPCAAGPGYRDHHHADDLCGDARRDPKPRGGSSTHRPLLEPHPATPTGPLAGTGNTGRSVFDAVVDVRCVSGPHTASHATPLPRGPNMLRSRGQSLTARQHDEQSPPARRRLAPPFSRRLRVSGVFTVNLG
jgi:hypothetical protein